MPPHPPARPPPPPPPPTCTPYCFGCVVSRCGGLWWWWYCGLCGFCGGLWGLLVFFFFFCFFFFVFCFGFFFVLFLWFFSFRVFLFFLLLFFFLFLFFFLYFFLPSARRPISPSQPYRTDPPMLEPSWKQPCSLGSAQRSLTPRGAHLLERLQDVFAELEHILRIWIRLCEVTGLVTRRSQLDSAR